MTILRNFFLLCVLMFALFGCEGGAVVFAPTPAPADQSPGRYTHPSGAFSVVLPRVWPLYEQNATTLASAAFSAPDGGTLLFAVINVGRELSDSEFIDAITRYQSQLRSDVAEYTEQNREQMPDGSWRMAGYRAIPGGYEQVNTFIQRVGGMIGLVEVVLPSDLARAADIEQIVNTFSVNPSGGLDEAGIETLAFAKPSSLAILHVATWLTPDGVFFVTGEVGNYGTVTSAPIPIEARLLASDGQTQIRGAADVTMGYGIPPGGFAPFSLRFGEGQPPDATQYALILGGEEWVPTEAEFSTSNELTWTDSSRFDGFNRLIITGEVTNQSAVTFSGVRAVVTVFNDLQQVIGAASADLAGVPLEPGAVTAFEIIVPEVGDVPANYIVTVQGIP